jgi:hypothetical protein
MAVAGAMTLLAVAPVTAAADYSITEPGDQQMLERALFLCLWKTSHDVPDSAPIPAVCKGGAVSVDTAMLQDKQWWTFWARLNHEEALKANQQFSSDFAGFHARLQIRPERAAQLLPPGVRLPQDDWRVRLIRELTQRYTRPAPSGG